MKNFLEILSENYKHCNDTMNMGLESKEEYVGSMIFDFTTYDGDLYSLFALEMIEVIDCILNRKTFKYIKDKNNYKNYILMCNMPFLVDKLEWGGSIRGAWFYQTKPYEFSCGEIKIGMGEMEQFFRELIYWVKNN